MDRPIVYPLAIPADTDFLSLARFAYIGLSGLAQTVIGTNVGLSGLPASPGSGLAVQIGAGFIYAPEQLDATNYGSLPASTSVVVKQGIYQGGTFNCPAPTTAGQTINYLVEVAQADVDTGLLVLSFYDSSNPSVPYTGPNNTGQSLPTVRSCTATLSLLSGVAATTGSQTTPTPSAGNVGAYVISVPAGATQITAAMISVYPGAPFIQPIGTTHGAVTLTGAGTFTVPAGVYAICVERWGGGAGGGGTSPGGYATSGGGGAYARDWLEVTPGEQIAYSCGSPGVGGTASVAATSGGATTFGGLPSVAGGQFGLSNGIGDGQGGAASAGSQFSISGGAGQGGFIISNGSVVTSIGNQGGNAPRGGQGGGMVNGNFGVAGSGVGAGGSAAGSTSSTGFTGGAGVAGGVVVSW